MQQRVTQAKRSRNCFMMEYELVSRGKQKRGAKESAMQCSLGQKQKLLRQIIRQTEFSSAIPIIYTQPPVLTSERERGCLCVYACMSVCLRVCRLVWIGFILSQTHRKQKPNLLTHPPTWYSMFVHRLQKALEDPKRTMDSSCFWLFLRWLDTVNG